MLIPVSSPNLDNFLEPTFIHVPKDLDIESPILNSHISLIGKEFEFQFFDLDLTLESKSALEPKVNFLKLVLVPEPITLEPKSAIPPSHILLLDIGIDHDDFVMIFQDRSCKGSKSHDWIFHDLIHIGDLIIYIEKRSIKMDSVNHHIISIG